MHAVRRLRSTQRIALLFLTGTFRKTSKDALNVLTGIPSIDHTLRNEVQYHRVARFGKEVRIYGTIFRRDDVEEQAMSTGIEPHLGLPYNVCLSNEAEAGTRIYTDGSKKVGSTSFA